MEFSFTMNPQDYYAAWEKRNNINSNNKKAAGFLIALSIFGVVLSLLVKDISTLFVCLMLVIIAIIIFKSSNGKKSVASSFMKSAVVQSPHTIRTYSEGLEILNSYEKMFVPWESIYKVLKTKTHLIILPTHAKGIIGIDMVRYASPELEGLYGVISSRVRVEEVRK